MAKTGNARGDIIVGDSGSPEVAIPLSAITGTITNQSSGKAVLAAASTLNIPFGGITSAQLVYMKIVNNSTKVPKSATVKIGTVPTAIVGEADTFLWISQNPVSTAVTAAAVTSDSDGIAVEVEWLVCGT